MAATHPGATRLRGLLSEAGFMAHRVEVEAAWLVALSDAGLPELPASPGARASACVSWWKVSPRPTPPASSDIERVTNHDVKAVEYWMKEKVADDAELARAAEFIHFACTSKTSTIPRTRSC